MVFMKILVFVIFLLLLGGFFIISNENIKLNSGKNVDKFINEYRVWLDKQVNGSVKIVGYVVDEIVKK